VKLNNFLADTTLVLFHGTLQRRTVWTQLITELTNSGVDESLILTPDLYEDNPPNLAEWIEEISKSIKTAFYIPIGYSLGGRFALDLAHIKPSQLKKIVLMATDPGIDDNDQEERELQINRDQKWADKFSNMNWVDLINEWNQLPTFAGKPNPTILTENNFNRASLSRLWLLCSKGKNPNRWPEVDKIANPGLVITGELDKKFDAFATKIAKSNPNFSHVQIPGVGHRVGWEEPKKFTEILINFLIENSEEK